MSLFTMSLFTQEMKCEMFYNVQTEKYEGYKMFYNVQTQKYELETERTPIHYEHAVEFFNTLEYGEEIVQKYNDQLERGTRKVFICCDCRTIVEMEYNEIEWYRDRGFDLPKRCFDCRNRRKADKRGF